MKNLLLTLSIAIAFSVSYAQTNTFPNSGNVGIGTTAPQAKLHLSSAATSELLLSDTDAGANVKNYGIYTESGKFYIRRLTDAYSGYDPSLTIDQGNVGIGTTNPSSILHLSNGGPSIILDANSQGTDKKRTYIATSEVDAGDFVIGTRYDNNTVKSRNFYINNAGNVGIGTTSPHDKLSILNQISLGSSASGYVSFFNGGSTRLGYIGNSTTNLQVSLENDGNFTVVNGKVGIGTTTPVNPLTVNGAITLNYDPIIYANMYFSSGSLRYNDNGYGNLIALNGNSTGDISFITSPNNTSGAGATASITEKMVIKNGGNVGIGTTSPDEKLTVKGNTHAAEVKVEALSAIPDYVFEPDYKLISLEEIKAYVDKNHHLPEIPSAKEIEKNGIQLGDMNMKLLKKIEELTLYLIEKDKQVTEQRKLLNDQQKINHSLQEQINQLKNK